MIKIVTDYPASLPQDMVDAYDITVVSSYVLFGSEKLREGIDLTNEQLFERMAESDEQPVTSPPSVEEYAALYDRMLGQAPDTTILSIHLSSEMSEMVSVAKEAASSFPDGDIHIFDSRSIGVPEGLMARQAAIMAQAGAGMDDILARLEVMRENARLFFIIDTLEYLERGGRIGKATYLLGSLLKAKPTLTLQNGEVTGYARFSSRESAISNLVNLVMSVARGKGGVQLGVVHAVCLEEAEHLAGGFRETLQPEVLFVSEISLAMAVHTGPGALGVGWYVPG